MNNKIISILLCFLFLVVFIEKIEYKDEPAGGGHGWRQVVILHCKEGKIKYSASQFNNELIPYGKVGIIEQNDFFKTVIIRKIRGIK